MKKNIIFIVAGIIVVAILGLFVSQSATETENATATINYTNATLGLSFTYPASYILIEKEVGSLHRAHHSITLIDKKDAEPRENSEGPTAITFDIYQNNLDQQSLISWLTGTNDSNYKLSQGTYASTTVAGVEAITYGWSGLYEGKTVAWRHRGNIIAASVTYMSLGDEIINDFDQIISTVSLTPGIPLTQEEAVSFIQGMWPEYESYPSENLPPKTIEAEMVENGDWKIAFITLGSGRPGILEAKCFNVTPSKEVTKIGELTVKTTEVVEKLNLATCEAAE